MSALNYGYVLSALDSHLTFSKKNDHLYFYLNLVETANLLDSQLKYVHLPTSYTRQLAEICANIQDGINYFLNTDIFNLESEDIISLKRHAKRIESNKVKLEDLDSILLDLVNLLRKYRVD